MLTSTLDKQFLMVGPCEPFIGPLFSGISRVVFELLTGSFLWEKAKDLKCVGLSQFATIQHTHLVIQISHFGKIWNKTLYAPSNWLQIMLAISNYVNWQFLFFLSREFIQPPTPSSAKSWINYCKGFSYQFEELFPKLKTINIINLSICMDQGIFIIPFLFSIFSIFQKIFNLSG